MYHYLGQHVCVQLNSAKSNEEQDRAANMTLNSPAAPVKVSALNAKTDKHTVFVVSVLERLKKVASL